MGDSVAPIWYPICDKPARARRTLSQSRWRSETSARTIASAACTPAMFDGDPDAVNTYDRAVKCSAFRAA